VQSPHAGCGGWFASIDIGCLRTGALTECHFWRAHSDTGCDFFRLIDASVCRFSTLMSVGSRCGGINLYVIGQGYMPGKSDSDILAPGNAAACGADVLTGEMSAAYFRHQF
jgi:hypothetical protein